MGDKAKFQGQEGKWELMERKRRTLIQTVVAQANDPGEHSKMSSALDDNTNKNAAFMEAVLKAEKANIERMAKAAKKGGSEDRDTGVGGQEVLERWPEKAG